MAEPETKVSAPASATSLILSSLIPPSISNLVYKFLSLIIYLSSTTFSNTESINFCPPKPGKTDISRIISNFSK